MAAELVPYVYHERQEPGSMLCAQHAINSLMQHRAMDASQLADIAKMLDERERAELGAETVAAARAADPRTANMDDTGFFSVAVIETALQAWGLRLERLAAPAMNQVRTEPQLQLAFLLNLDSHWFGYRSFGTNSHFWFNLNSFLPSPQPVGSLYLSELLRASEAEHYTVFVVLPDSPEAAHAFHRTEADQMADVLDSAPNGTSNRSIQRSATTANIDRANHANPINLTGSDQEDMEFQAALQASLAEHQSSSLIGQQRPQNVLPSISIPTGARSPPSSNLRPQRRRRRAHRRSTTDNADDPQEAEAEPERAGSSRPILMDRRRSSRENSSRQAISLSSSETSNSWGPSSLSARMSRRGEVGSEPAMGADDENRIADMLSSSARSPFSHPAVLGTVEGGQSDSDVDHVDLRNARAPSADGPSSIQSTRSGGPASERRRHRRQRRHERAGRERDMLEDHAAAEEASAAGYDEIGFDDLDMADDSFADLQQAMWDRAAADFAAADRSRAQDFEGESSFEPGSSFTTAGDRTYDDEDAALQAALAASMGDSSMLDRLHSNPSHAALVSQQDRFSAGGSAAVSGTASPASRQPEGDAPADVKRIAQMRAEAAAESQRETTAQENSSGAQSSSATADKDSTNREDSESEEEEDVSPEEMRRRRLARFG